MGIFPLTSASFGPDLLSRLIIYFCLKNIMIYESVSVQGTSGSQLSTYSSVSVI